MNMPKLQGVRSIEVVFTLGNSERIVLSSPAHTIVASDMKKSLHCSKNKNFQNRELYHISSIV